MSTWKNKMLVRKMQNDCNASHNKICERTSDGGGDDNKKGDDVYRDKGEQRSCGNENDADDDDNDTSAAINTMIVQQTDSFQFDVCQCRFDQNHTTNAAPHEERALFEITLQNLQNISQAFVHLRESSARTSRLFSAALMRYRYECTARIKKMINLLEKKDRRIEKLKKRYKRLVRSNCLSANSNSFFCNVLNNTPICVSLTNSKICNEKSNYKMIIVTHHKKRHEIAFHVRLNTLHDQLMSVIAYRKTCDPHQDIGVCMSVAKNKFTADRVCVKPNFVRFARGTDAAEFVADVKRILLV
ncbi:hypothetical protein [Lambdina fiscellaria nucleopolyhedrovirus]|uniref:Uncharacterized protein n=1 Tax=Lambdina fiscellaria nucleopolyhedrovirus TaxID=1642929 RepID=A0A0E3UR93_9ABAC|nr:hypothetical protein [Lambdina fiscellaria nucleopolyhedrovirus]AKC91635.1 hypothetical protein [Lambdina fiscellaria nucleopolyhedrovirus]